MRIIFLMRSMSLIGMVVIWLLSFVCLLIRIMTRFLRYTSYTDLIKKHIKHVLLLILVHIRTTFTSELSILLTFYL